MKNILTYCVYFMKVSQQPQQQQQQQQPTNATQGQNFIYSTNATSGTTAIQPKPLLPQQVQTVQNINVINSNGTADGTNQLILNRTGTPTIIATTSASGSSIANASANLNPNIIAQQQFRQAANQAQTQATLQAQSQQQQPIQPQPTQQMPQQQQQQQQTPSRMDLLRCLRKFLHTLLELANNSLPEKYPIVQNLIQELLDDRIDPETFIKLIQIEKNPPSPSLIPFLKVNYFYMNIKSVRSDICR